MKTIKVLLVDVFESMILIHYHLV